MSDKSGLNKSGQDKSGLDKGGLENNCLEKGGLDKSSQANKVPIHKSLKRPPPPLLIGPPLNQDISQKKQKMTTNKRSSTEDLAQEMSENSVSKPGEVPVKQEMTQVTLVDLEEDEDPGDVFPPGPQETVYGDSSIVAGYGRGGAYNEQNYYDDSIVEQDDRVSLF